MIIVMKIMVVVMKIMMNNIFLVYVNGMIIYYSIIQLKRQKIKENMVYILRSNEKYHFYKKKYLRFLMENRNLIMGKLESRHGKNRISSWKTRISSWENQNL